MKRHKKIALQQADCTGAFPSTVLSTKLHKLAILYCDWFNIWKPGAPVLQKELKNSSSDCHLSFNALRLNHAKNSPSRKT